MDALQAIEAKYQALSGRLDEATLRPWVATEARSLDRGGVSLVAKAAGVSRTTIYAGLAELEAASMASRQPGTASATASGAVRRVRAVGGGRKKLIDLNPGLLESLDALVEPTSRGDPMSPLRRTCQSTTRLAQELDLMGHTVSQRTVCDLLARLNYSLQSVRKTREGSHHPDRDAQFHHIAKAVAQYQRQRQPVISVDTKKKELIGDFKNAGREWRPAGDPEQVHVQDFIDAELGKVTAPTGCTTSLPMKAGSAWASITIRPSSLIQSIRRWWFEMGRPLYPEAKRLLITADCGGSNGYRVRLWRLQLQRLADEVGLAVQVCHSPRARASGTRSSTGCSATSPTTGAAGRC